MKVFSALLFLMMFIAAGAQSHEGMIALYADEAATDCDAVILPTQTVNLYLFYVRGDGPDMGNAYEFKLAKSSEGAVFGQFVLPANTIHIGQVEEGISVAFVGSGNVGEGLDLLFLGTIPVTDISETGPFTVSVVEDPHARGGAGVFITLYVPLVHPMYRVIGGTFVFNGSCSSPENPAEITATTPSNWGAIKSLYR
jgi:hypothetical protein